MKILLAPDSFKGSLSAQEVCEAMRLGIAAVDPSCVVHAMPLADGGEGTMAALAEVLAVTWQVRRVSGPLGKAVEARFGLTADGSCALLEMASASGLTLVPVAERDPLLASSYGTGELLRQALDSGVQRIILGIGGSATNDGGAGMLQALGFALLDAAAQPLPRGAAALIHLHHIDDSQVHPRLKQVEWTVACDVTNPLLGPDGASTVYGPQKGARPDDILQLEAALARLADVVETKLAQNWRQLPGTGAAGGMGFSLLSLCGAHLLNGFQCLAQILQLGPRLQREAYDWIFTGEGRIDEQSARGKLLSGLGALAQQSQTRVVAFTGSLDVAIEERGISGIDLMLPIVIAPCSLDEAMREAEGLLRAAVSRLMRLLALAKGV